MQSKLQRLNTLNEIEFHELLLKLLTKMGAKDVRHTHGTNEHGKDIVFHKEDSFGKTFCAVVAKVGNISGAAGGTGNLSNLLRTINYQIESSFKVRHSNVASDNPHSNRINEVIVWTTGTISHTAQDRIRAGLDSEYRNVRFRDGIATVTLIDSHLPAFFEISDLTIKNYFDKGVSQVSCD